MTFRAEVGNDDAVDLDVVLVDAFGDDALLLAVLEDVGEERHGRGREDLVARREEADLRAGECERVSAARQRQALEQRRETHLQVTLSVHFCDPPPHIALLPAHLPRVDHLRLLRSRTRRRLLLALVPLAIQVLHLHRLVLLPALAPRRAHRRPHQLDAPPRIHKRRRARAAPGLARAVLVLEHDEAPSCCAVAHDERGGAGARARGDGRVDDEGRGRERGVRGVGARVEREGEGERLERV